MVCQWNKVKLVPAVLSVLMMAAGANAATYNWAGNAGATLNWAVDANWVESGFPNAVGDVAIFGNVISEDTTVVLTQDITIGEIQFEESSNAYIIESGGAIAGGTPKLVFDNGGTDAIISGGAANTVAHLINSPILHSCMRGVGAAATKLVTINGEITGGEVATLILPPENLSTFELAGANTFNGDVIVQGGSLELTGGSAIPDERSLHIEDSGTVSVTGAGTEDVHCLLLGGKAMPPGTYDAGNSDGFITAGSIHSLSVCPAVSEWGLAVFCLAMMSIGTVLLRQRGTATLRCG